MGTIIYYGGYKIVKYPNIIVGKNIKDFGYGFYCTRIKEQAEKLVNKYKTPVINSYALADISDLNVKVFEKYDKEWLDFVVHCRSGGEHDYDIVEGFMCDDTILDNLEDYINGHIDKTRFLEMMKLKWSNKQISFHTVKALKGLKFIECEKIKK